jgi:hypothetical protein
MASPHNDETECSCSHNEEVIEPFIVESPVNICDEQLLAEKYIQEHPNTATFTILYELAFHRGNLDCVDYWLRRKMDIDSDLMDSILVRMRSVLNDMGDECDRIIDGLWHTVTKDTCDEYVQNFEYALRFRKEMFERTKIKKLNPILTSRDPNTQFRILAVYIAIGHCRPNKMMKLANEYIAMFKWRNFLRAISSPHQNYNVRTVNQKYDMLGHEIRMYEEKYRRDMNVTLKAAGYDTHQSTAEDGEFDIEESGSTDAGWEEWILDRIRHEATIKKISDQ